MTSGADAAADAAHEEILRGATTGTEERPAQQLAEPVMLFDLQEQARLLAEEPEMESSGHNANTLVHFPDFRVVLISIKKGDMLREHRAPGRISIQPVQGRVVVRVEGRSLEMAERQLLVLEKLIVHEVEALDDAVILLTLGSPMRA